jgi:hypothetical protein
LAQSVIEHDSKHAQNQRHRCDDGQSAVLPGTSRGLKCGVVDDFERCLIEVAVFVRVRIEEKTLGATLHGKKIK